MKRIKQACCAAAAAIVMFLNGTPASAANRTDITGTFCGSSDKKIIEAEKRSNVWTYDPADDNTRCPGSYISLTQTIISVTRNPSEREKAAREEQRQAVVQPFKEKAAKCVVNKLGPEVSVEAISTILHEGACAKEGKALREKLMEQFSLSGHYMYMDFYHDLVDDVFVARED